MPQSGNPEQRDGEGGLHAELGCQPPTSECPVCFASPLETISSGLQARNRLAPNTQSTNPSFSFNQEGKEDGRRKEGI